MIHAESVAKPINWAIAHLGIRIVRSGAHDWSDPQQFLPLDETLSAANEAGLSVADYVDVEYNVKGATQETIDHMEELGVFANPIETVVEIGPGTGRYLEKIIRRCAPHRYEICETAAPWADYLVKKYNVVRQPTNGKDLSSTASNSVDLVQAHKVLVITPFVDTCRYWREMLRVARPGAHIVFDIVTERCMNPETLNLWIDTDTNYGNFPAIVPREYALQSFRAAGAELKGSFFIPMRPGKTEVMVFRTSLH